jgi:hypothetical protein
MVIFQESLILCKSAAAAGVQRMRMLARAQHEALAEVRHESEHSCYFRNSDNAKSSGINRTCRDGDVVQTYLLETALAT